MRKRRRSEIESESWNGSPNQSRNANGTGKKNRKPNRMEARDGLELASPLISDDEYETLDKPYSVVGFVAREMVGRLYARASTIEYDEKFNFILTQFKRFLNLMNDFVVFENIHHLYLTRLLIHTFFGILSFRKINKYIVRKKILC